MSSLLEPMRRHAIVLETDLGEVVHDHVNLFWRPLLTHVLQAVGDSPAQRRR